MGKLLGIDPGERWVGLATTDETETLASPFETVDRESTDLQDRLREVVEEEAISKVVVGFPEPLAVDRNERTGQVEVFIREFVEPLGIEHEIISERYTTKEAKRLRKLRNKPPSETADAEAAALILQHYLDQPPRSQVNKDTTS